MTQMARMATDPSERAIYALDVSTPTPTMLATPSPIPDHSPMDATGCDRSDTGAGGSDASCDVVSNGASVSPKRERVDCRRSATASELPWDHGSTTTLLHRHR